MSLTTCDCRKGLLLAALITVSWAGSGCSRIEPGLPSAPTSGAPGRIVSLAPSVTDVLVRLGLGDRVVGVTRYCDRSGVSDQAVDLGGYLDVHLEALVGLQPDLTIMIQDHGALQSRLTSLGFETLRVDQSSMEGILQSITRISEVSGVPERGERLVGDLQDRLRRVSEATRSLKPQRVMVVVGRDVGTGTPASVWVAGRSTFYDDVLRLAGGHNAVAQTAVAYPDLSLEGMLHLDPDVILDLLTDLEDPHVEASTARMDWSSLASLRAVREDRVFVLEQRYAVVPGPGVVDLVERVARLLHPEVVW